MWQHRSDGSIKGINGKVDMNYSYKDYPTLIANMHKENGTSRSNKKETNANDKLEKLKQEKWEQYYKLAQEVWQGKWGSGDDRKKRLASAGYDYATVQGKVNELLAVYYPKYTGTSKQIDTVFKAIGVPAKFVGNSMKRKPIATANGISNYKGTASQNLSLIALAKQGKLKSV